MNPIPNARRLRRKQSKEAKQLWQALRAGRFAGFKFRREHPVGPYFLDFYCPEARLDVELDGFEHGLPQQWHQDQERTKYLERQDIEALRFWNRAWRESREGVLVEIWHALQRRTGCVQIMRMEQNQRYVPPDPRRFTEKPPAPPIWYPGERKDKRAQRRGQAGGGGS